MDSHTLLKLNWKIKSSEIFANAQWISIFLPISSLKHLLNLQTVTKRKRQRSFVSWWHLSSQSNFFLDRDQFGLPYSTNKLLPINCSSCQVNSSSMQSPRCSFLHKWEYQEFSRLVGHLVYWNCQINSWFLTNVLHRLSKTTVTFVGHGSKYVSVCIVMLLSSRVLMREKCLHDPKIAYLASVVWFFFSLMALNKRNLGGFLASSFFSYPCRYIKEKEEDLKASSSLWIHIYRGGGPNDRFKPIWRKGNARLKRP